VRSCLLTQSQRSGFPVIFPLERRSRKDKSGDSAIKLALIAPINSNRKLSRACGPGESSTVQTETTPHWRQEYNTLTFPRLLGGRNCPRSLLSPEKSARGRVRWCASAFFMCRFCCTGVHNSTCMREVTIVPEIPWELKSFYITLATVARAV